MRVGLCLTLLFVVGLLAWFGRAQTTSPAREDKATALEVRGKTRPVPGRKGVVAPAVLHPVVEVMASAGDRVKKGQPLVKLDDDEPRADVRSRKAALESAEIALKEADRHLAASKRAYDVGALPGADYHAARVGALKAEQDQRVAKAALEASEAELEHYTVTAPIDGVIAWLDVNPGTVARPGTSVWGEVIDLSEIDVECGLTPEQAERVTVGQKAEVSPDGRPGVWSGEVVFVGVAADAQTGRVPVKVRVKEARGRVRSHIKAKVRFGGQTAGGPAKDAPPIH